MALHRVLLFAALCTPGAPRPAVAQLSPRERQRAHQILGTAVGDLRARYWDTTFGGLDLDSLQRFAEAAIDSAPANAYAYGAIAKIFLALDDSHTRFLPPLYAGQTRLGWRARYLGDSLYVTYVEGAFARSDTVQARAEAAEAGRLQVGDRIVALNGWAVDRRGWQSFAYIVEDLQPRERIAVRVARGDSLLDLVVPLQHSEGRAFYDLSAYGGGADWGTFRRDLARRFRGSIFDSEFSYLGDQVLYWKLTSFAVSLAHLDEGIREARGRGTLILDLRGNPGGLVTTALGLIARLAPAEAEGDTVALVRERERLSAQVVPRIAARLRWTGRLIVLVDGGSASASELVADAIQRNGWGTVLGDRTAGALSVGRLWSHASSGATTTFYADAIAVGMIERPDGSRIEKVGVMPDELAVPTPEDLLGRRDPVMARAMQIAGLPYDPGDAYEQATWTDKYTDDRH